MLPSATLSRLRSLLSSHCACSPFLSSHAWVPALNASLQSCPFTTAFVRRHSDCIENLRSRFFDAITGFELPCRTNYHFPPPGGSTQRKTIVNSWVRCLENSQTIINYQVWLPTANCRKWSNSDCLSRTVYNTNQYICIFKFISSCFYNVNIISPTKVSWKSHFSNRATFTTWRPHNLSVWSVCEPIEHYFIM